MREKRYKYIMKKDKLKKILKENKDEKVGLSLWDIRYPEALSKEQNHALLMEYRQTQDEEQKRKIRDRIVYGNMPLALRYFSHHYFSRDFQSKDDVLQEAALAIARSVESFDLDRDIAFSTYLEQCFKHVLADQLQLDEIRRSCVGLNQSVSTTTNDENFVYEEIVEEPYFDNAWVVDKAEVDYILQTILPKFSEAEQKVFLNVFVEGKTQMQVAKEFHVSRQYISKVTAAMIKTIRSLYEEGECTFAKKHRDSMTYDARQKISSAKKNAALSKNSKKEEKIK